MEDYPAELGASTAHRECFLGILPGSLEVMSSDLEILSNSRSLQNQFFNETALGKVEIAAIPRPCHPRPR